MSLLEGNAGLKSRVKSQMLGIIGPYGDRKLRHIKCKFDAFAIRRLGFSSPRVLMIDITYDCNLSCLTCQVPTIGKTIYKNRPPLKLADFATLFRDFKRLGGTVLALSGGEPFLHPEFGSILAIGKEMGFRIEVFSNHTVMNEKNAQYVSDYVDRITLSLDGPSAEVHDAIRGKGAFRRALKGRKTLRRILAEHKKEGVSQTINCTISKYNYKWMSQMVELASTLGMKHINFNYVSVVPDAIDEKTERIVGIKRFPEESHFRLDDSLRIPRYQIEESCMCANEAKARGNEIGVTVSCDCAFDGKHNDSMVTGEFRLTKMTSCNTFWNSIGVLPDGSYFLCMMMQQYPITNIRECKLEDFLKHPDRIRVQKIMEQDTWLPICRYCCAHSLYAV